MEREREKGNKDVVGGEGEVSVHTSSPSAGLSGEVEEAVGEVEEEVEDGDEGEVALLGLTSISFFSFRSTCLLFGPGERKRGKYTINRNKTTAEKATGTGKHTTRWLSWELKKKRTK